MKRLVRIVVVAISVLIGLGNATAQTGPTTKKQNASRTQTSAVVNRREPAAAARLRLGLGIVATVVSARTWDAFDGRQPDTGCECWTSGNVEIHGLPYIPGQSKLASGNRAVESDSGASYLLRAEPFQGENAVKPAGRFVEVVLSLAPDTSAESTAEVIPIARKLPDFRLQVDKDTKLPPRAILFPGADLASGSLVTGFEGGLKLKLKPTQKSWLIVVFDSPETLTKASLLVGPGVAVPLPVRAE